MIDIIVYQNTSVFRLPYHKQNVKKSLDSIRDAITNIDDAVAYAKTEKIVSSDEKRNDLDKILLILGSVGS